MRKGASRSALARDCRALVRAAAGKHHEHADLLERVGGLREAQPAAEDVRHVRRPAVEAVKDVRREDDRRECGSVQEDGQARVRASGERGGRRDARSRLRGPLRLQRRDVRLRGRAGAAAKAPLDLLGLRRRLAPIIIKNRVGSVKNPL